MRSDRRHYHPRYQVGRPLGARFKPVTRKAPELMATTQDEQT